MEEMQAQRLNVREAAVVDQLPLLLLLLLLLQFILVNIEMMICC